MFRIFTYPDLGELRVYIYDDTFWFVAADLVDLLEFFVVAPILIVAFLLTE